MEPRERAFAHDLAYGVTRMRGRLDHLLSPWIHRGLEALDARVLEVLRLGAYQLLYMGGVPTYAAVSASVDQVRSVCGPKPVGLVNAVLRKVADAGDGPACFPSPDDDPATFLSSWGSHPRWLVERWLARWPFDEVRGLVEANNRRPRLYLTPLDGDADGAVVVLAEAGLAATSVGGGTTSVALGEEVGPAEALAALPSSVVQDPGANLVVVYSRVPPGTIVADLCAAPGGKVLVASEGARYTLASDRSESRIRMVRENALRTGRRVGLVVADARRPPIAAADVVMVDVPCTGTGTLARHPDARWRLTPDAVTRMAALQDEILEGSAASVRPGGLLVYSTCSLEPEENGERVRSFLSDHTAFHREPTDAVPPGHLDADGDLIVTPQATGFDGAYAARLRRAA